MHPAKREDNSMFLEEIKADIYRWYGSVSVGLFCKALLSKRGFRFILALRLAHHFGKIPLLGWLCIANYKFYKIIYSSDINFRTKIGAGARFHHVIGTAWATDAIIGKNATITHNVTLGNKKGDSPVIGDNVYLAPGCCVIGKVTIGNNVIIGANAVVAKNIPDNAIVVGNPAKIISYNGSADYIENPWPLVRLDQNNSKPQSIKEVKK